jgi:hypothetical protein
MKFLRSIICSLGVLAMAGTGAVAAEYTDFDQFYKLMGPGGVNSYTDTFNIATDDADGIADGVGFSNGSETVTYATANFTFRDSDNFESRVSIVLGADNFASGALVKVNNTEINGNEVTLVFTLNQNNGIVSYTVSYAGGDAFYFTAASLYAETAPGVMVPDGGVTLAFLGASMLGVFGLRRRMAVERS